MNINLVSVLTDAVLAGAEHQPSDREDATVLALRALSELSVVDIPGPKMADLIESVAIKHGVTVADIKGPYRTQSIVDARWAFIAAATERGHSKSAIGRAVNKDHTSVLHALREMGIQ